MTPRGLTARPSDAQVRTSPAVLAVVAILLALMTFLAGGAAHRESITYDEVAHIAAGVSYLQKLDLRMNLEHPPLSKVIAAVPLWIRGAHADYNNFAWTFSNGKTAFVNQYIGEWVFGHWFVMKWNDPQTTVWWARLPMLLVSLILGLVLFRVASRLGNTWGGLLCLAAYVSAPAVLAFAPLVINDIVIALFWLLVVWYMPAMWRDPSRADIIKLGLALAGALLSKFSGGLLFFVFAAMALSVRFRPLPGSSGKEPKAHPWRHFAAATLLAAIVVYVAYLLLSWNQPTDSFEAIRHFPASPVLRRLLMPMWLYVQGLLGFVVSAGSRPTFILGHHYPHGVWFYFPALFLLKSQIGYLCLLLVAVVSVVARSRAKGRIGAIAPGMELHWRAIWISLVMFVAACMTNRLNMSIRHFSVAVVLSVLLLAPLPRLLQHSLPRRLATSLTTLTVALAIVCIANAVRMYPNYIPYINALGMGKPAWQLMNDSNVDWNQSLPEAERFVRDQNLPEVLLDQYGSIEAAAYLPGAQLWDCQQPVASDGGKWAIVSTNFIDSAGTCRWLLQYSHRVLAGGSMLAVHLPEAIPAAGVVGGPPSPAEFRYIMGVPFDIRPLFLRCIRDPQQLPFVRDEFIARGRAQKRNR